MVVFGSKSASAKTKIFEQPLDKLLSPKTVKQLNEAIRRQCKTNNNTVNQVGSRRTYLDKTVPQVQRRQDPEEEERCRQLMLNVLPEPIKHLLLELYARGPSTVGIFRKSPNAKHCKELKQKLETVDGYKSIEQFQVNVIASVFKEWLRSLPDCLLMSRLYPQWIDISKLIEPLHLDKIRQQQRDLTNNADVENDIEVIDRHQPCPNDSRVQALLAMTPFELRERHSECVRIVRQLLDALNETNLILLRAIVCVLWHIAQNSDYNKMCSNNLGVCIGQSLLNDEHQQKKSRRSSSLGLSGTMQSNYNLSTSPSSTSSALKNFSTSTFAKRHRRTRSQCLLASTLSLTNLSSQLSSSPSSQITASTTNLKQQVNNSSTNHLNSNDAQEAAKYVPILVAYMIDNAEDLFGSHIVNLFGPQQNEQLVSPELQSLEVTKLSSQGNGNKLVSDIEAGSLASHTSKNDINLHDFNDNTLHTSQTSNGVLNFSEPAILLDRQSSKAESNCDFDPRQDRSPELVVGSSACNFITSANKRQHRRDPSMSFITVQVGGHTGHDHVVTSSTPVETEVKKLIDPGRQLGPGVKTTASGNVSASSTSSDAVVPSTTTSILIVNSPKKPDQHHDRLEGKATSCTNDSSDCSYGDKELHSQSVSSPYGNTAITYPLEQQQQRPLSATESTTSSSRASSSTSGIHSESPAFSNESDNHHHACDNRSRHTQPRSSHRSLSTSISSPDSSSSSNPSICTSPNVDEMDTVDVDLHHSHHNDVQFDRVQFINKHRLIDGKTSVQNNFDGVLDHTNNFISKLAPAGSLDNAHKAITVDRSDHKPVCRRGENERPKSMVNLRRVQGASVDSNMMLRTPDEQYKNISQQLCSDQNSTYTNLVGGNSKNNIYDPVRYQSQTLNRSASSNHQHQQHPVMFNRLPKIPFQFTTSCYGGEAVLYYPTNSHLSQRSYPMHKGCNRVQSLDRQASQAQNLQQNLPQRSHVMMLRDYYLSLQEQSQRQHHQVRLINCSQQRASTAPDGHQNYLQRPQKQQQQQFLQQRQSSSSQHLVLPNVHQQHQPHSMQSLELSRPSTLSQFSRFPNGLYCPTGTDITAADDIHLSHSQQQQTNLQQPASAAVAYQRIRPRFAKIRQNQFNGLYVKRASSPHSITRSTSGNGVCGDGLIVRPIDTLEPVSGLNLKKSSNGSCSASLMALSQSSLSQQSSKMSSSSDSAEHSADESDCSTGEWMESTMV